MASADSDKEVERQRYDARAQSMLVDAAPQQSGSGSSGQLYLEPPYGLFRDLLQKRLHAGTQKVLEIGAGTGAFTGALVASGAHVIATDISESSLDVIRQKFAECDRLETKVADMEALPFEDAAFDVVVSAGSLSYGDNDIVLSEIYRVLKSGGSYICVDSLNHNPIYRLNRWLHYMRGDRTKATLQRMPTTGLIRRYIGKFGKGEVRYFGSIVWLMPVIALVAGPEKQRAISNAVDRLFRVKKTAFKFVMIVEKV